MTADFPVLRDWTIRPDGCLHGRVFYRVGFNDGTAFRTSRVVAVRHRLAVTQSGTIYFLAPVPRAAAHALHTWLGYRTGTRFKRAEGFQPHALSHIG